MHGLMMDRQLVIPAIIEHAGRYHGETEVVSVDTRGGQTRTNYAEVRRRALRMGAALSTCGLSRGDRVATIAWNNYRHLELYFAISGAGFVMHTINPRLFPEQLVYIINDAEDRILFFDASFLPIVDGIREKCPGVERWVVMEARDEALAEGRPWLTFHEDMLAEGDADWRWPADLDEREASSLCYTSGTTGNPKGVLYSHRSTLIHALVSATPDVMNVSARDCVLPVVPMFHVNSWGLAYSAPMIGAKLVLPGPGLDGKSLTDLYNAEGVTFSAGVPTIWAGLLAHLDATGTRLASLKRTIVGGSACPPSVIARFRDEHGVEVIHAWGMTELSPLGTVNNLKNRHLSLSDEEQQTLRLTQGRPPFGIELGVFDDDDNPLPHDGEAQGNLYCRGFWVIDQYFRGAGGDPKHADPEGGAPWFPTGDVATLDPEGNMVIRDRSKDIIKSGGEWISTVDLENLAVAHPAVRDAAVIAARHPKWDERPLLVVVPKEGRSLSDEEMRAFYEGKVARWWIPDGVQIVEEIPRNATGKVRKNVLRERYGEVLMTRAAAGQGEAAE